MKPYSMDLRERVRAALQASAFSQSQIAAKYDLSLRTVENWARQLRETGSIAPKARRHGPTRTLAVCEPIIRKVVLTQPDITLSELCVRVVTETRVQGSASMMCRELQHLNLPRKKGTTRQSTRNRTRPKTTSRISRQDRGDPALHRPTPKIHR